MTAIAIAIAYRSPLGLDVVEALGRGEQVRVPMKGRTVRSYRPDTDAEWEPYPWGEGSWSVDAMKFPELATERLVAPIQPATPCPDCDSDGWNVEIISDDGYFETVDVDCDNCAGSGWVGGDLGLVTEQCRVSSGPNGWGQWYVPVGGLVPDNVELRVERRPVVPWRTQVTDWTDGFATLVGPWPIDPPVVDMPCPYCNGTKRLVPSGVGYVPCLECTHGRVPLSVDPGEAVTL